MPPDVVGDEWPGKTGSLCSRKSVSWPIPSWERRVSFQGLFTERGAALLRLHPLRHLEKRLTVAFSEVMIALSGRNPGLVAVQHPLEFASLRKVRYALPYLTRFRGIQFEYSNGSIQTGNIRYALLVRGANVLRQTEHHGSIPPNFWS
jgi:hypothetical protein